MSQISHHGIKKLMTGKSDILTAATPILLGVGLVGYVYKKVTQPHDKNNVKEIPKKEVSFNERFGI